MNEQVNECTINLQRWMKLSLSLRWHDKWFNWFKRSKFNLRNRKSSKQIQSSSCVGLKNTNYSSLRLHGKQTEVMKSSALWGKLDYTIWQEKIKIPFILLMIPAHKLNNTRFEQWSILNIDHSSSKTVWGKSLAFDHYLIGKVSRF